MGCMSRVSPPPPPPGILKDAIDYGWQIWLKWGFKNFSYRGALSCFPKLFLWAVCNAVEETGWVGSWLVSKNRESGWSACSELSMCKTLQKQAQAASMFFIMKSHLITHISFKVPLLCNHHSGKVCDPASRLEPLSVYVLLRIRLKIIMSPVSHVFWNRLIENPPLCSRN